MKKFEGSKMAKAGRGDDQYMLRFPPGLRERVKSAAETNGRSMNSELIQRIEDSFAMEVVTPGARSGYLEMPDGITVEDVAQAIETANRQAMTLAFKRLGLQVRDFAPEPLDNDE